MNANRYQIVTPDKPCVFRTITDEFDSYRVTEIQVSPPVLAGDGAERVLVAATFARPAVPTVTIRLRVAVDRQQPKQITLCRWSFPCASGGQGELPFVANRLQGDTHPAIAHLVNVTPLTADANCMALACAEQANRMFLCRVMEALTTHLTHATAQQVAESHDNMAALAVAMRLGVSMLEPFRSTPPPPNQ